MKVLFVTGEYPPLQGGVGDYTAALAYHLARLGVEVTVLTSSAAAKQIGWGERVQERMEADDTSAYSSVSVRSIPAVEHWNTRSWRTVAAAVRRTGAQVVHIQYQTGAFEMHPAINLLPLWLRLWQGQLRRSHPVERIACVSTFHDLRKPYLFPKAGPVRSLANRMLARSSDATILTNDEDYRQATKYQPNSYLIPIGSNIPETPPPGFDRDAWRKRMGLSPNDLLLAYFGFINNTKGVDTLLQAMEGLLQQERRIKLLIVGGTTDSSNPVNREEEKAIRAMADRAGLRGNILWTGFAGPAECSAHLLCADIAALPFKDGVSMRRGTLMAVLTHGLPLVTTYPPSGSLPAEIPQSRQTISVSLPRLVDGENALLVQPGNHTELAQAIARLIDDRDLRECLSIRAREIARAFAWEDIAARTFALYRQLVPNGDAPKEA